MKHIYSLRKFVFLFIGALVVASHAIAQCGPVVENFNNTGGSMAGFSSSTFLSSAPGFTYGQTGPNGYLQRCNIPAAGTVFTITSPTYQSFASATTVGWGFTLTGDVQASQVDVFLQYIDNSNNINSVNIYTNTAPSYTGSGSSQQLVLCETRDISTITGFTAGERYRIVVQLTAATASNNNECMVFDDFRTSGAASAATLPVSFIGFGVKKTETGIELIWNVAGERNVQGYTVERSNNGKDFIRLGDVAANNSTAYSFMDAQPANGLVFYRIKETDIDGKFRYSTIVRLNLNSNIHLSMYPSPARDLITIEHAITSKGTLSITTTDGRVVKQIEVKPQLTQTVIAVSNLKAGLYIVQFKNADGQTENIKFVKE